MPSFTEVSDSVPVRYAPPDEVTAGLARLVWQGRYDLRVFTAAILSLAAKGWVAIEETHLGPELTPTGMGAVLARREEALLLRLFSGRDTLLLDASAYIDLKAAQEVHFHALMEEDDAFFCSPLAGGIVGSIAAWVWPSEVRRTRMLRKQAEGYRRYLHTAMASRLDPVFLPGRQLDDLCHAMPYLVAFDVPNSWADEFAASVADLLDDTPITTSLYELGDRAKRRRARQREYLKGYKAPQAGEILIK